MPDLDGLFVLGSSGERPRPTTSPPRIRVAVEQSAGGSVRRHRRHGPEPAGTRDRHSGAGADYRLAAPLYYPITSEARIVEYFASVAERAAVPVVLYNIPQNTHLPLAPSVVRALARHPRIVGIKDSAGDWFAFEEFLALRTDDFSVLQGRERLAAISLWSGADGLISAMANFAPRLLQGVAASVQEARPRSDTLALQATVGELAAVFDQGDWLAGLSATQACGWDVGEPSLPCRPATRTSAAIDRIVASASAAG